MRKGRTSQSSKIGDMECYLLGNLLYIKIGQHSDTALSSKSLIVFFSKLQIPNRFFFWSVQFISLFVR